jgi:hypothetical protein
MEEKDEHKTDFNELLSCQKAHGKYSSMNLKKNASVYLDLKLEGVDKTQANGQAYISVGRCAVVDPAPLMFCPEVAGGENMVAAKHDYTTITCEQLTIADEGWRDAVLGVLDVFHPVRKKDLTDLRCGYPELEDPKERTIKNMFEATVDWKGASGVVSQRKQVNCFFFCFFVVPCLI